MSRRSIDALIRGLGREPEPGGDGPESPADRRDLRLALHGLLDGADARVARRANEDPAAEHMRIAAYLGGGMEAEERAAFEAELTRSPELRNELESAAAWLDATGEHTRSIPQALTAQAIALGAARQPAMPRTWLRALLGWPRATIRSANPRLPGRAPALAPRSGARWAMAGTALAGILVIVAAAQILRHLPGSGLPGTREMAHDERVVPPAEPPLPSNSESKTAIAVERIGASSDVIKAVKAYAGNPSVQNRDALIAALRQAKAEKLNDTAAIYVKKELAERLDRQGEALPTEIVLKIFDDGTVLLDLPP